MASTPDKTRRPGYAPAANVGVGRRGLHTRDRILTCAADVFLVNGFHGTSLDTIAKAASASRATVYQYFAGKEEIFRELSVSAERDVLDHADRLGDLSPTHDGIEALHGWLAQWADLYDSHAAVFAEYPGIGTELSVIEVGTVAETFAEAVTIRVRGAAVEGLDPDDAAAALMRIPHMVHLYRYRAMFSLPARDVVTSSLTVALQLMLFPDTPDDVLSAVLPPNRPEPAGPLPEADPRPAATATGLAPIALDVLSVSSALFAECGYYAVGMEQIAAAAAVSRATLYRYFSTKVEILAELTRKAVDEIEVQSAVLPGLEADSLARWMLGYVRFHRDYGGVIRAWLDGTVAEQLSDAEVGHGIGAVHRAVLALLDTVDLPARIDVRVASTVFLAVLGRMTEATAAAESGTDERAADLMATLLRRSILRSL
ncbi:TetR/AcrR family transcriptional regulator [Mycolicibacterium hodleri]|uniref:TetR/AcrR family transcriptional regulator n=1 Tax=Mycolicibacterium hodleri TaxID=49897 RepID=A0A502EFZ3_9MYCO|nr:TetR/AcrR family transcriptional regulator [Mycolicibacterium hodleri]TPG36608.1 TetR/AcrR family transcriptional regulator [Mycolicibacterium hodleri]